MPAPVIPVQTPIVGAKGIVSPDWWQFLQQLVSGAGNQTTVTEDYTVDPGDVTIFCDGTFTLTFPVSGPCAGKVWHVFNQGTGTITIAASSGTVQGTSSIGAAAGATVLTDGNNLKVH